ncbi:hypothetical protein DID78_00935 [Candidatus Marinamargulisbacteria bacterium SCGC AG-343-D04]|nr:hypothetical protein DID78_00935 [Candidatus Marinamargulisbacteria bacterium SCGC AG-343-D04]
MRHIDLFVFQKNTDLNALSAYEAVHHFMNKEECRGLRRFVHWRLSYRDDVDSLEFVKTVTSSSFYLLNTNKEGFYINHFPKASGSDHVVHIDVRNELLQDSQELARKINRKCDVDIVDLKRSVVWECRVQASSYEEARNYVDAHVCDTVSHDQGLLVNPIYESYDFLDQSFVSG